MLARAYGGELWPELGSWAAEGAEGDEKRHALKHDDDPVRQKKRRFEEVEREAKDKGSGVTFAP